MLGNTTSFTSPEGISMLSIAVVCDLVSIATTILLPTIIGGLLSIVPCLILDFFCLVIIGAWMYSRSGRSAEGPDRESERQPEIKSIEREDVGGKGEKTAGKAEASTARAAEKEAAQEAERMAARSAGKLAAKTAVKSGGRKIGAKLIGSFFATLVPILQLIPFWTITVVGELKD
ncbi:MAG: hypothetical protein ABH919_04285 [bacterium]